MDDALTLAIAGGVAAAVVAVAANTYRRGFVPPEQFSYIVPNSEDRAKGLGAIHRHPSTVNGLHGVFATGERTLYETFQGGLKKSPNSPCLGHRPITGKDAKGAPVAGPYVWQTYTEVFTRASNFGSGLMNLDLVPVLPGTSITGPLRTLGFFLKNRPEWVIAEQGGFCHSVTTCPLYDTLGLDTVEMIINETEMTTVVCSPKEMKILLDGKPRCASLKNLVVVDKPSPELFQLAEKLGVKVYLFEDVEQSGKQKPVPVDPPKPDSIATFCYTSGTTGKCKGALLTHANIIADVVAVSEAGSMLYSTDRHLSYLPLAHSFERNVTALFLFVGARVGFYQGDPTKIPDDIKALKPTAFPSVPRLLNRVYDKVMTTVAQSGPVKAKLFQMAYDAKLWGLRRGHLKHRLWDKIIFSKVAAKTGLEQCRFIFVGSAPLAPHVHDFLRIVLSCPVIEGYGQTETAAGASTTHFFDTRTGLAGVPMPCNEIRLVSIPEMNYLITDSSHGGDSGPALPCRGRGEICCRGPNIFKGYYKMEQATAETLDKDGWVHTGDIGLWTVDGVLKIIDRKKNIFKLSQGEYVAPEKVENIYCKSNFISQCFVYGDSFHSQCMAIVVPDQDAVKHWATEKGLSGTFEELCARPELKTRILEEMEAQRKEAKLLGFEHAKVIHLDPVPFSMANGLLTPTFKLVRDSAKKHYKAQIEALFNELEHVGGRRIRQGEI
eukprot:RCo047128